MNFQDASNLRIPEGYVRTIHDKNNRLLWGSVGYDVSFDGNATQTTYSGKNKVDGANPTDANFATASLSNNVITVSSTATDTIPYARWVIDNLSANDVVRYSGVIMDSNGQIVLQYDNNGTWTTISGSTRQYSDGTTPATYAWTNTGNTTKVRFLLYANKSIPTGSSSSRYQNAILTVNNSDLSYEPYVGGIPAPNPEFPQPISTVTGENVVKVVGKNLLGESHDNYGIIASTGTVTQIANRFALVARVQEGQTYVTSRSAVGTSTYFYMGFFKEKPVIGSRSITYADMGASTLQRTITAPSGAKYCAIFYGAGTSPDCQLELGSTATSYQAYTEQEFEVNLGKNLLDSTIEQGSLSSSDGLPSSSPTRVRTASYISGKESTTYTINAMTNSEQAQTIAFFYKADNTFLGRSATSFVTTPHTFTTPAETAKLKFAFTNRTSTNITPSELVDVQLEAGSKATSWSPYFTPLELAKIGTYQDRIYKDGGKWYVEKQVGKRVLNGSESDWSFQSSNAPFRYRLTGSYATYDDASTFISDYFQSVAWNASWVNYDYLMSPNSENNILAFRYKGISTLEDFKTWLSTHPTTVYYALATPTTTEITDATLIAQLEAVYDWVRRHGYNAQVSGDLPIVINRSTLS